MNLERLLIHLYPPLGLWRIMALTGCPLEADQSLGLWTASHSGVVRNIHRTHHLPFFHVHRPSESRVKRPSLKLVWGSDPDL